MLDGPTIVIYEYHMRKLGMDIRGVLGGMPTCEHDYRPVRRGYRGQPIPKITDQVPLSIHGLAYVSPAVPATQSLVDAFLTANAA